MPSINRFVNEVEITGFTQDGTWNAHDLSGVLENQDAKAVIVRFHNITGLQTVGVREVGSSDTGTTTVRARYSTAVVGLVGGTSIEILGTGVVMYLQGEVLNHYKGHDTVPLYNLDEGQYQDWIDHRVTLEPGDSYADVKSVMIRVRSRINNAFYGLRERDSADLPMELDAINGINFFVIGVDYDGYYQLYTDGPIGDDDAYCEFSEVGYFTMQSAVETILTPDTEAMPATVGFQTTPAFFYLPNTGSRAILLGGYWGDIQTASHRDAYLRATGSTESDNVRISRDTSTAGCVALDDDELCEYTKLSATSLDFYIYWYETEYNNPGQAKASLGPSSKATAYASASSLAKGALGPSTAGRAGTYSAVDASATFGKAADAYASLGVN